MKKPVLIIIAGPNGSGKTSITSKILQHEWVELSADDKIDFVLRAKQNGYFISFFLWALKARQLMLVVLLKELWKVVTMFQSQRLFQDTVSL